MKLKRLALRLLAGICLAAVFIVATSSAFVLHLGLPRGRRLVSEVLTKQLVSNLRGTFTIGSLERLRPTEVRFASFSVRDPEGRTVLFATGITAELGLFELLRSLALGGDAVDLRIDFAHIDRAEAHWYADPSTGLPSLVRAFQGRDTQPSKPGSGRPVRVSIRSVELSRGYARGAPAGLPTLELEVRQVRGSIEVTTERTEVRIARFGTVVRGLGGVDARGVGSLMVRAPGWVWSSFDGHFGDVQVGGIVRVDGRRLIASVDLPRARPVELQALIPGYPLQDDASAHLELNGELPLLAARAKVEIGRTRATASGPILLGGTPHASLEVSGQHVDLAVLIAGAPHSDLDFNSSLELGSNSGAASIAFEGLTREGQVARVPVPAAEVRGTYRQGLLSGTARLREPGAPTQAAFAIRPNGVINVSAEARGVELQRARRLRSWLGAHGTVDLRVSAQVEAQRVTLDLNGEVERFSRGNLALDRGRVSGRIQGPIENLRGLSLKLDFEGEKLTASSLQLAKFGGSLEGRADRPRARLSLSDTAGATLDLQADVIPQAEGARIEGLELVLRRNQVELVGSVTEATILPDHLRLRDLELKGASGNLTASLELTPELLTAKASSKDLDLGAIAQLLGVSSHTLAGKLDLDTDLLLARDLERGKLEVQLREASLGPLSNVSFHLQSELWQRHLQAESQLEVGGLARGQAKVDVELPDSARHFESLQNAVGTVDLELSQVDLGVLGQVLALGRTSPVQGKLAFAARLERRGPYVLPSLRLTGFTDGLEVDGSRLRDQGKNLSGLDLRFGLNLSGESGQSDLSVKVVDTHGVLASASVATTLDLVALLRAPHEFGNQFQRTEFVSKLLLDERPFEQLPLLLQPVGATGRVRAEAAATGTLLSPLVSGRVRISDFEWVAGEGSPPLDLCANLGWEHQSRRVGASGEVFLSKTRRELCSGRRVGQFSVNAITPAAGPLNPHWQGSAVASLQQLPLDALPGLAGVGITGGVSGNVSLTEAGSVPVLSANLNLSNTAMRDLPLGDGRIVIRSNEQALGATLDLSRGSGTVRATALAALDYQGDWPRLRRGEPIGLRLEARDADAVLLAPLARDVLSELNGRMDAALALSLFLPDDDSTNRALTGKVEGTMALHDGTLEIAGLGLRLREVELVARAEPDGAETRISIGQLRARAARRGQTVSVRNGRLWLKGLRIERAEGAIDATELPLVSGGVALATATTRQSIDFSVHRTPKEMQGRLSVPYLLIALPQSSGRNLISLDDNRAIELLQPIGEPRSRSGEALPWRFVIELGQNVKLTRSDLDLPLSGRAEAVIADHFSVTGDFDLLTGGRVDVSGKTFVIESGEVHFDNGETDNPRIRVTALWRAPDGSEITATVIGTLKQASITLSSPGKSLQEIYALLLGGTGAGEGGDAQVATAAVGADQLLGPLLANTPLRRVEIRTGSEQTADQRTYSTYTAAVPIGDRVWFEGSYKTLNSGESPEQNNAWSGTVDWRFRRNWSLRTEVGTIGTGVDLVWNYRY